MRFLTFLLYLITSCSTMVKQVPSLSTIVPTSSVSTPIETKLVGTVTFKPDLKYTNASEKAIIEKASLKLNEVTHSTCFHDFISNRKMIQTNNKTPSEVASHLASLNGHIDVLMYFNRWTSAIAFRQPPSLKINLNRNYFTASKSICQWASTMAHEGLGHALGNYEHSFNATKDRDYSVPYSINAAFEMCCH